MSNYVKQLAYLFCLFDDLYLSFLSARSVDDGHADGLGEAENNNDIKRYTPRSLSS